MAISFSRPDPASPSAVGSASFTSSRRGFDQGEVREFLRMVAAELARLQEREKFLEGELRELQTRGLSAPGRLDEETVTTILGEEAARVLAAARDAAVEIRERAEDSATRLVKEAVEDAARIKESAREEAMRVREDANVDIEAEIELAKQQGRDLVVEAREYREKMLAELTRRRDAAKAQIDKLVHERERLVGAFQRAKMTADEALAFLRSAHDDDEEYIFDFSRPPGSKDAASSATPVAPSKQTKPSEVSGSSGIFDYTADIERSAAETSGEPGEPGIAGTSPTTARADDATVKPRGMPELPKRPAFLGPPEETSKQDAFGPIDLHPADVEVVDEEEPLEQEDTSGVIVTSVREMEAGDVDLDENTGSDTDTIPVADHVDHFDDSDKFDDADETNDADDADGHLAPVVSLFGDRRRQTSGPTNDARSQHPVTAGPLETSEPPEPIAVGEPPSTTLAVEVPVADAAPSRVDEIFAKLRAGSTAAVTKSVREALAATAVPVVAAPFTPKRDPKRLAKRAVVLAPIIADMDTRLKRALADDLNEVLERLSHKRASLTLDNVMGPADEHSRRLAAALANEFRAAATEGAKSMKSAHGSVRRINATALREDLERTIGQLLVDDLRAAMGVVIEAAAGDRARVSEGARTIYRDARSRVSDVAADIAHEGHAAGAFMSLEQGTPVCWVVDPDGPECADGEDNSLAGGVECGREFPTGDKRPLAHAGCRCLLGPAQH